MQQHQLRLDFNLKAARGLKEAHEHQAQRDFFERAVKVRLAHGPNGGLELVHPGGRRHPARFNVQLGHAFVVAPEKGGEILRQVLFVDLVERAHDAEVQRDVAAKGLGRQAHLDVAGVHVGVEKTVSEDLGEKDGHAVAGELFDVHPSLAQALHLVDGHALHALHDHHVGHAIVPDDLRNHHQVQALHVAAQLGGVGGFAQQVELVVEVGVELGHHLSRLEALAVGRQALHPAGHHVHEGQVFFNQAQHAWPQDLDSHLAPLRQSGKVNLRDGGAGHGLALEGGKNLVQRAAKRALDDGHCHIGVKRLHLVLQKGQLVGNFGRQEVTPGGEHLAKLDENGT